MAKPTYPLFEKFAPKNTIQRCLDTTILFLLLSLLVYRLLNLSSHGFTWLLAFLCESWFTFDWVLLLNAKWNPLIYRTYPERLVEMVPELPPVDLFVTTADPILEPPMLTINTVISLLAADYPAEKLACYISDDGCSPLTFYSLNEASKFAKLWLPFCKKYNIQVRAPFRYFSGEDISLATNSFEFQQESANMKNEYEQLSRKIEAAAHKNVPCELKGEFAVFSNTERNNHPTVLKVIWDNQENLSNGLPYLVYISREKRPKHPHHFKAGAMNVLTRVSGVMTNAPFMLNVDCDMYMNNPQIILHAMCLMLGSRNENDCGFVQCPQRFYNIRKDDTWGSIQQVMEEHVVPGVGDIQGPLFVGSGCFHRRRVIYDLGPEGERNKATKLTSINADEDLITKFGKSNELIKSASDALKGRTYYPFDLLTSIEAAHHVAGCNYESGTCWGTKVGWTYGRTTNEDFITSLTIHSKGWRSTRLSPEPPAFLGCAPSGGLAVIVQLKKWYTGMLEIFFSRNNPIFATVTARLQFRQCLIYIFFLKGGLNSIPLLCYSALPAYCIIVNSSFMPKVHEPAIYMLVALSAIFQLYTLSLYLQTGFSIRVWGNSQRVGILIFSGQLHGLLRFITNFIGLSEQVFEVTKKEQPASSDGDDVDVGRFTFNDSPIFVPGTTILLVQLVALALSFLGLQPLADDGNRSGLPEILCSVTVVLFSGPFLKGLYERGKYGIPMSTICKSASLAFLFVYLSRCISMS
ncbi:Cellulose_synt domain-containing protein [Cephalotus follicularis]|uniref:Cellulose_synt domain-containing protein n=1 Tax=Cephalotus follicularis TaxID=3775 RepID=A0A1Q3D4S0_CEPFO|nr:Cellulose_synt domain-containing protein [Cephalotus follicularis]